MRWDKYAHCAHQTVLLYAVQIAHFFNVVMPNHPAKSGIVNITNQYHPAKSILPEYGFVKTVTQFTWASVHIKDTDVYR